MARFFRGLTAGQGGAAWSITKSLISKGFSQQTVRRRLAAAGIFPDRIQFSEFAKKIGENKINVARFKRARGTTLMDAGRITLSKTPERMRNNYSVTFRLRSVDPETEEAFDTFRSIGFDEPLTKSEIEELGQSSLVDTPTSCDFVNKEIIDVERLSRRV